jgi:hypothetical protein
MKTIVSTTFIILLLLFPSISFCDNLYVTLESVKDVQSISGPLKLRVSVQGLKGSTYLTRCFYYTETYLPCAKLDFKIVWPDGYKAPLLDVDILQYEVVAETTPGDFFSISEGETFEKEIDITYDGYFPYVISREGVVRISAEVTFYTQKWFKNRMRNKSLKKNENWSNLIKNRDKIASGTYTTNTITVEITK